MVVEILPLALGVVMLMISRVAEAQVSLSSRYSTTYTVTTPTSGAKEMVTEVSVRSERRGGTPEAGGKSTGEKGELVG